MQAQLARLQQQQALARQQQQQAQQAAQQLGMPGGGGGGAGGKPVVGSSLPATDPHGLLALLRVRRAGSGEGYGSAEGFVIPAGPAALAVAPASLHCFVACTLRHDCLLECSLEYMTEYMTEHMWKA